MVRLSKQRQEKLENIMNLVEELGVDRVLARLRQTKMMSKEVLDDMKEWETDYEKRVALLGFLVSPEGKRAFGALYELAKVHEEQVRLQEEQEKLRQEQVEMRRGVSGSGPTTNGGKQGGSNMKNKLRAQLHKKKTQTSQAGPAQNGGAPGGKSKRLSNKKAEENEDPLLEEAARTLKEAQRQVQEKKRIDAMRSHLATSETNDNHPSAGSRRSAGSQRSTPTPKPETSMSTIESARNEKVLRSGSDTNHSAREDSKSGAKNRESRSEPDSEQGKLEVKSTPKALNDFTKQKQTGRSQEEDKSCTDESSWNRFHSSEVQLAADRAQDLSKTTTREKQNANEKTVIENCDVTEENFSEFEAKYEKRKATSNDEGISQLSESKISTSDLTGALLLLYVGKISAQQLKQPLINDVVGEWKLLRMERERIREDLRSQFCKTEELSELIKTSDEEKELLRAEKDRFVLKEYELQQKHQELILKHKSLRDDYETLKQGSYQVQQNNKKSNKLLLEMKKKIAKLESKIKSMDKVTIRRGTQTEDHQDKDVHEALRMTEESLSVTQSDLATSLAKLKSAHQEVEDYKKQVNIKGREINKRERKSKKDEDTIRIMSRERDAIENKLRKMTEQMEYYKGMAEAKGKGNSKKANSEKKEVKVQRCASGRHILIKTVVSPPHHDNADTGVDGSRPQSRPNRQSSLKQSNKSKQSNHDKPTSSNSNKKSPVTNSSDKNTRSSVHVPAEAQKTPAQSSANKNNQTNPANEKSSNVSSSKLTPKPAATSNVEANSVLSKRQQSGGNDGKPSKTAQLPQKNNKK